MIENANENDNSLPRLSALLAQRLALVGTLATSLEEGRLALIRHDAEAIARGAAHQAELCRQWELLEKQLRAEAAGRRLRLVSARTPNHDLDSEPAASSEAKRSAQLEAEWQALAKRIAYLTRVHSSLLRHMQRSLGILQRVVDSCANTYTPGPGAVASAVPVRAGG